MYMVLHVPLEPVTDPKPVITSDGFKTHLLCPSVLMFAESLSYIHAYNMEDFRLLFCHEVLSMLESWDPCIPNAASVESMPAGFFGL